MEILRTGLKTLLGEKCFTSLWDNLDYGDLACLKLVISKGLGLGIILGSSIVKIPQIYKIVQAQSTRGLSFSSYALETLALQVVVAYNYRNGFPFSTWGESVFLLLQNLLILATFLKFHDKKVFSSFSALMALYGALAYAALVPGPSGSYQLGLDHLSWLQTMTIPLFVASRVPQIWENWSNHSTGQLSAFTVINYWMGSLARVFTTLQEVNDQILLVGHCLGYLLNTILAFQLFIYWNSPVQAKAKPKKE